MFADKTTFIMRDQLQGELQVTEIEGTVEEIKSPSLAEQLTKMIVATSAAFVASKVAERTFDVLVAKYRNRG